MNPCFQGFERILGEDRHFFLKQNRSAIHSLVGHQVDHHAGMLYLAPTVGLIGPLNGVGARKSAGQGRV